MEHGPYPRENPYLGFGGSSRGTRLHPVDTLVQSFQYPHDAHRHDAHRDGASDHRLIQSLVIPAKFIRGLEGQTRMKYRKLRIAFSATCGIACVLLVVLWVRSYWWVDDFRSPSPNIAIKSLPGRLEVGAAYDPSHEILFHGRRIESYRVEDYHLVGRVMPGIQRYLSRISDNSLCRPLLVSRLSSPSPLSHSLGSPGDSASALC